MTNLCTCGPLNAVQTCFVCISIICEILIYASSVHGTFSSMPFHYPFDWIESSSQIGMPHSLAMYVVITMYECLEGKWDAILAHCLVTFLNTTLAETNCLSRIPLFHLGKWYMRPTGIQRNKSIVIIANKYWYITIAWCIRISLSLKASDKSYLIPAASLLPQSNQMHNWYSNINK